MQLLILMSSCFYITFISKASFCCICSLYPQAVLILVAPIPLNTYLSGKQSELIISLVLFKAGRQKAHLLWGMSSRNSALLPSSLPIFAHHPLQGTEIFLNETGMHRFVMFAIQKGRISSTKVVEKEIIKSFSMKV